MSNHVSRAMLSHGVLLMAFFFFPLAVQAAPQKVWQVGAFDESSHEFKAEGIDYSSPAADPVFTPGKSDPATDWYAFQPSSAKGKAGFRPHPFTIKLDLASAPKGVFTLKVWLLAYMARVPRLQVEINGHRGLFYLRPKLNYAGGTRTPYSSRIIHMGRSLPNFPRSLW